MSDPNATSASAASPRLNLGAAYYPEQWPEGRWPEDIRLMQAAGFTVVRMAEFAWSTLEPSPGEFNFDWLERAIQLLAEKGIETVLGTPTAAPPAWPHPVWYRGPGARGHQPVVCGQADAGRQAAARLGGAARED